MASKIADTLHQKIALDNGLRLIISEMPHTRSVSIVFFIGSGVCYEIEAENGISHFIEHLCFKGTNRRQTSKEISEAIEGIGGILNGGTDKELTVFWCKVASQHFDSALDVLVDLVRNSRFDLKDIDKERQVIIEEIKMNLDSPQQRVDMLIDELLWPGQPLGRDSAGKKEVVDSLTKQHIVDFFHQHYLPGNIVLSIAGNVEQAKVQDVVSKHLGNWKSKKLALRLPSRFEQEVSRVRVETRDTEQVNLCLGVHGPSFLHPDRFAVDLLSIVLGEGMSSRFFIELRENQGIAYDISSGTAHFADSGAFYVTAGVDPKRLNKALISILEQLSKVKDGVEESELNRAKELAKGQLLLALEDSRFVANRFGAQELLTGRVLTIDEVISLIDSVTTDNLRYIAQRLFVTEQLNLAIVGPVSKDEDFVKILKL